MQTQDKIVDRIKQVEGSSEFFKGFRIEVLIKALDFEHAKEYLKPEVTQEEWDKTRSKDLVQAAKDYLQFAFGKAADHRGISAERSVMKLEEFAWLLEREDAIEALEIAPYPQYGVPKLYAFAKVMGYDLPTESRKRLDLMAKGKPCSADCNEGCGG